MHDLHLVGVHDDGEHLVLSGGDGQRYRVRIDEPLRAAVRRDRARLGQLQIQIAGALRPRDIQARIRAGETAEDVAASSGLPLEHVRRYEGPVLAERAHVAELARRLPARQVKHRPPFGDLVAQRLTARGVDAAAATWDAWRRDGSTWTVQLAFRAGSKDRTAQWAYDVQRSHLEPLDDEARWLSAATDTAEAPIPGRRLAAVSERVYDVEADGGVRPADGQSDADPLAAAQAGSSEGQEAGPDHPEEGAGGPRTLDLLDALRGRRGRRQPVQHAEEDDDVLGGLLADPAEDHGADPEEAALQGDPPAAHPPASRPHEAVDAEVLALPGDEDQQELPPLGDEEDAAGRAETAEPDADVRQAEAVPAGASPARRGDGGGKGSARSRRASVPSWDEIVFGAKRD